MKRFVLAALPVAAVLLLAPPAARAQTPPVRYEIENNELKTPGPILFETGGDKIKPESRDVLQFVKGYLDDKSYISLMRVEVHTDNQGSADANQALSEKRALSVVRALVALGVDCKRILPVGFGPNKPIAANDSPENKAKNRRVSFINAALRGRAIGGMPADGGGKVAGDSCK